jgi:hypothetical protein
MKKLLELLKLQRERPGLLGLFAEHLIFITLLTARDSHAQTIVHYYFNSTSRNIYAGYSLVASS